MAWLSDDFVHLARVELSTGHHIRPIRASDVDIDHPAVMGAWQRLWAKYGEAWGWPPVTMMVEQDRDDLARHEREIEARETFNYAVLDAGETELLGCVYIDPPGDELAAGHRRHHVVVGCRSPCRGRAGGRSRRLRAPLAHRDLGLPIGPHPPLTRSGWRHFLADTRVWRRLGQSVRICDHERGSERWSNMWTRIARLVVGLLLALGVIGVVFLVGMRTKSPLVLNAVRRSGRATKPFVLKSSGTPGGIASIVRHAGRTTGRPYETPVQAVATDDGFVIALPYGPNTDWLKNVLVCRSATIVHEGTTYRVDRPEIVPTSVAAALFPPKDQRTHRLFRVEQCLLVRRVEPVDAADPA